MTNELVIVTNVVSREITGLDVVKHVDEFYSTSFDHLLWVLGTLILLLGVVVPLVFYFFQKRQLAMKEKILANDLGEKFAKLEESLRAESSNFLAKERKSLAESLEQMTKKMDVSSNEMAGAVNLIQTFNLLEKGHHSAAFVFYEQTVSYAVKTGNPLTIQQAVRFGIQTVLPRMSRKDFSNKKSIEDFNRALEGAKKIEAQGLLSTDIDAIKKSLAEAQERE